MSKVSASVLAANVLDIGRDVERMLSSGVDMLHVDIMDGHFVSNLSYGPSLVSALRKSFPGTYLDVHLMMDNPGAYIEVFRKSGSDAITIHAEAVHELPDILLQIKNLGVSCGVAIKPSTPAESISHVLALANLVLVMTVEPGFGGQPFIPEMLNKVTHLRELGYNGQIAVDGGVGSQNAERITESGVDILVMGAALFSHDNPAEMIRACHALGGKFENRK